MFYRPILSLYPFSRALLGMNIESCDVDIMQYKEILSLSELLAFDHFALTSSFITKKPAKWSRYQGRMVDALALGAEEGRGQLR